MKKRNKIPKVGLSLWLGSLFFLLIMNFELAADDHSVVSSPTAYPYNMIVKVISGKDILRVEHECSGAIVGVNLVLTAAHCLSFDKESGNLNETYIFTKYDQGHTEILAKATLAVFGGHFKKTQALNEDWAILRTDKRLLLEGEKFLDVLETQNLGELQSLQLPGFSNNFEYGEVLSFDPHCHVTEIKSAPSTFWENLIKKDYSGVMVHNCLSTEGASGGPLLKCVSNNQCYVVGINVAESKIFPDKNRYACHPSRFLKFLKELSLTTL